MTTTYEQERAKALAYVRRQCDAWRREMGMPSRTQENLARVAEAAARVDLSGFSRSMARVVENLRAAERYALPARFIVGAVNPAAPDGFNNWEPGPIWSIPDESPRIYIDISDTPAPIFEAVVATLGEPPL